MDDGIEALNTDVQLKDSAMRVGLGGCSACVLSRGWQETQHSVSELNQTVERLTDQNQQLQLDAKSNQVTLDAKQLELESLRGNLQVGQLPTGAAC